MQRRNFIKAIPGAAAAWPAVVLAQSAGMPVVGFLSSQSAGPAVANRVAGFRAGLSELNYVEGRNVLVEYRWAEGRYDQLPALARDLVHRKVAVIAALTQDAALAAKAATSTLPIVFNVGGDPVKHGLAASMNRPGGNATGVSMFTNQLEGKRLGLLHEMVPKVTAIGVLINPDNASADSQQKEVEGAARSLGLQIHLRHASRANDLPTACEGLVQAGAQALMPAADPFFANQRVSLVSLAAKYRLAAIWEWPDFVEGGGLMSYGTSIVDNYRQAGVYTGRILKGAAPADLPVLQPTKFVLAVNLQTARALGIEVPPTLIGRADDVIE